MPDSVPLWFVQVYGLIWLGVARLAVAIWRNRRERRASKEMLMRLWRWRDC